MLMPLLCMLAAGVGAALMYAGMSMRARRGSAAGPGGARLPKQSLAELQRFRAAVDRCADSIYMIDKETLQFVDATAAGEGPWPSDDQRDVRPRVINPDRLQLIHIFDINLRQRRITNVARIYG